jgi:hypothetical protein
LHLLLGSNAEDGTTNKSEAKQDSHLQHILRKTLPYINDINAPDDSDLTPLHHLFFFNGDMPTTLTLLLRHGADPWRQSRIGAMPIQLAKQAGQGSIMALFLAVAPDPASPTFGVAQYERVVKALTEFDASDHALVGRKLGDRKDRLRGIETVLRGQCSDKAGL